MEQTHNYAGFWRRFLATSVDGLILGLIGIGISLSLGSNPFANEAKTNLEVIDRVLTFVVSVVYSILFWVNYDGATPGKKLLAIKVVTSDGKPVNYATSLVRYFGYILSLLPLALGYLWVIWDKKKQGWHDKIANTVVVKTEKSPRILLALVIVILGYIIMIGAYAVPEITKEVQKEGAQVERQEKYSEAVTNYAEDVNRLKPETRELLKSAQSKIVEANNKASKSSGTEAEKEEIRKLIADAIEDATKAKAAEPENVVTWVQLGNIYTTLIGVATNADTFAIESYQKAILLEPKNYLYYEKLGGVYFRLKNYEQAIEQFRKVVELSPAYANGYYNLGVAYKEYGAKSKAKEALQKALDLLPSNDPDRYKAEKELESL